MSQRRRYIVTYDIRDPRRLRKVFKTMKTYGEPLQYSVFACDLSKIERLRMLTDLGQVIEATDDSIMIVDLGEVAAAAQLRVEYIGPRRPLPDGGPTII